MRVYEFSFDIGWISRKRAEINKFRHFGVLHRDVGIPCSNLGPCQGMDERRHGQASGTLRHSEATSRRRSKPQHSSVTPRRSYYSQHGNFCVFVLFCFSVTSRNCILD